LRKKGKLLETIIESTDPDIIIGTETWLDPTFRSSEIFPDYYLYDIERRDRPKDSHGGVFIAAKKQLKAPTSIFFFLSKLTLPVISSMSLLFVLFPS
jgi:hypothetical protein